MKASMRRIKEFDSLYDRVDTFMKRVDPCSIVDGKCIRARETPNKEMCCTGCTHIGDNGCNAVKPITCRAWLCDYARVNLACLSLDDSHEHWSLYNEVMFRFYKPRKSREEILQLQ